VELIDDVIYKDRNNKHLVLLFDEFYWADWATIKESGHKSDISYSVWNINGFRQWLHQLYLTINNLNEDWNTTYTDWNEVDPTDLAVFDEALERRDPHMLWDNYLVYNFLGGINSTIIQIKQLNPDISVGVLAWNLKFGRSYDSKFHLSLSQYSLGDFIFVKPALGLHGHFDHLMNEIAASRIAPEKSHIYSFRGVKEKETGIFPFFEFAHYSPLSIARANDGLLMNAWTSSNGDPTYYDYPMLWDDLKLLLNNIPRDQLPNGSNVLYMLGPTAYTDYEKSDEFHIYAAMLYLLGIPIEINDYLLFEYLTRSKSYDVVVYNHNLGVGDHIHKLFDKIIEYAKNGGTLITSNWNPLHDRLLALLGVTKENVILSALLEPRITLSDGTYAILPTDPVYDDMSSKYVLYPTNATTIAHWSDNSVAGIEIPYHKGRIVLLGIPSFTQDLSYLSNQYKMFSSEFIRYLHFWKTLLSKYTNTLDIDKKFMLENYSLVSIRDTKSNKLILAYNLGTRAQNVTISIPTPTQGILYVDRYKSTWNTTHTIISTTVEARRGRFMSVLSSVVFNFSITETTGGNVVSLNLVYPNLSYTIDNSNETWSQQVVYSAYEPKEILANNVFITRVNESTFGQYQFDCWYYDENSKLLFVKTYHNIVTVEIFLHAF